MTDISYATEALEAAAEFLQYVNAHHTSGGFPVQNTDHAFRLGKMCLQQQTLDLACLRTSYPTRWDSRERESEKMTVCRALHTLPNLRDFSLDSRNVRLAHLTCLVATASQLTSLDVPGNGFAATQNVACCQKHASSGMFVTFASKCDKLC